MSRAGRGRGGFSVGHGRVCAEAPTQSKRGNTKKDKKPQRHRDTEKKTFGLQGPRRLQRTSRAAARSPYFLCVSVSPWLFPFCVHGNLCVVIAPPLYRAAAG